MKFFTPGRTEIIGNHTDHQLGRVIAAAVRQGVSADCRKADGRRARIASRGFPPIDADLDDLAPRPSERGTPEALVRGMACALRERGFSVGGFEGNFTSSLRPGGGLSSSAAFTVLTGKIFSALYNGGAIPPRTVAECAHEAENVHFGKPSGLMDQLVCAEGKTLYMDFLTGESEPLDCDFDPMGLALCLTDTGGSHAACTSAYAAIAADMRSVAGEFGKEYLGYVNPKDFRAAACPRDAAHLRAEHFFEENERVPMMRDAIARDGAECIRLMNDSGRSSEEKLRNIFAPGGDMRLAEGLELSAKILDGCGAWRVHGGGFAGCVQALVPERLLETYRSAMESRFGSGCLIRIM